MSERGKRPTSKNRVRAKIRAQAVAQAAAEVAKQVLEQGPPDADGLTPAHWQVFRKYGLNKMTIAAIAKELDISASHVARLLKETADKMEKLPAITIAQRRALEVEHLDEITAAFLPLIRTEKPDKAAADVLIKTSMRRDRLLGLSPRPDVRADTAPEGKADVVVWSKLEEEELLSADDREEDAKLNAALGEMAGEPDA